MERKTSLCEHRGRWDEILALEKSVAALASFSLGPEFHLWLLHCRALSGPSALLFAFNKFKSVPIFQNDHH